VRGVVGHGRVFDAHRDDLVVEPLLVAHAHHADGARFDHRRRVHGLLAQHQRIQRIPIVTERARDEAVVGRVVHGAVEHAVEPHEARFLVELVLVLAAHRDLDHDGEDLGDEVVVNVEVVPRVHGGILTHAVLGVRS